MRRSSIDLAHTDRIPLQLNLKSRGNRGREDRNRFPAYYFVVITLTGFKFLFIQFVQRNNAEDPALRIRYKRAEGRQ